jgi:hypothetical protein
VAVVVSIARGHDASYPFKTIGAADGAAITGERGAGYYLSAVEKGGEPAGTWVGNGAAQLGFNDRETVRREDFEPLYGQFLDPRDPSGRTYLGSPPRVNAELAAIYQAKLATRRTRRRMSGCACWPKPGRSTRGRWGCSTSTPRSRWTRRSHWRTPAPWPRQSRPGRPVTCGRRPMGGTGGRDLGRDREIGPAVCPVHAGRGRLCADRSSWPADRPRGGRAVRGRP